MTTLDDRPASALLVVDAQHGVVADAVRRDAVVGTIAGLVERARSEGVPVVWVQHRSEELVPETEAWGIVAELAPADGEPVVHKEHGDSFEATDLEDLLADRGVGRLVVAGAQSDACVRSTLHGAFTRGYDVTLVADGHTTEDLTQWGAPAPEEVIAHTNLYWRFQTAPGRVAEVADAADVELTTPATSAP